MKKRACFSSVFAVVALKWHCTGISLTVLNRRHLKSYVQQFCEGSSKKARGYNIWNAEQAKLLYSFSSEDMFQSWFDVKKIAEIFLSETSQKP